MKKKLRDIAAAMGVRPGEGRLAGTFMLYSFLLGLSASIIDVGSYALFLSSFGANSLPWVYIGVGVTLTAGSFIYAWLIERMSFDRFLRGSSAAYWQRHWLARWGPRICSALPASSE